MRRNYYRLLEYIADQLETLNRKVDLMAVDQATFDAALVAFSADLDTGLAAIAAAIAAAPAGTPVDLTNELATLTAAKASFDAAVAADAPAPPVPPVVPPA